MFDTKSEFLDSTGGARYLSQPELVFERLWATPDTALHSLNDSENVVGSVV